MDAYRAIHPDPAAKPGYTWTPRPDPHQKPEVMDRIDLIYASRAGTKVRGVQVVGMPGEEGKESDLTVDPWTSDHRAVVAEIDIE